MCKQNGRQRRRPPSVYEVGEIVLIRYPGRSSKLVKKRYVLKAKVLKRKLDKHLYKVLFVSPTSEKELNKWISVCDITSTTIEKERKKRGKARKTGKEKKIC